MEVLISGISVHESDYLGVNGECTGWCPYNPDSNCWDDGD